MKKLVSIVLALAMILMVGAAFAANNTINVQNAKNGETYNIYKMLDLSVGYEKDSEGNATTTIDSYRYTINTKWSGFWTTGDGAAYIDTNTSGSDTYVVWKNDKKSAADMEAFGKAAAAYAAENNIAPDKSAVVAANDAAGWTGLDDGYYLVTTTYGTAASVASTPTNPAQTISEKNVGDTTDKDVEEAAERNGTSASWGESNDAAIGDTVTFRSKVIIAKNSTNVAYHDTMTAGLTWSGTATVYTDEACTTALENTSNANYSVAAGSSGETFVVTFTQDYLDGLTAAATNLWIKYTAVLNDNAQVASEEENTPKITWGNDGEYTGEPTETTTHKFQILKYDGADPEHNPLAGAKFKLYTSNADDAVALKLAVNAAGTIYRVVDTSDSGATLPTGYTLVSDDKIITLASGNITVEGVDSDDYYLRETDAPTGFTPIEGPIKVEVDTSNDLVQPVENKSGTVLPSTGGIGTTIFYIVGGLLLVGAAVILVARRKAQD